MIINDRTIIADKGMILTNGTTYATKIRLGSWDDENNYYQITIEEYEEYLASQEEEEI